MRLTDICLITEDVPRLAAFYAGVLNTGGQGDAVHMAFPLEAGGIAIYARKAAEADMGFDFSEYSGVGCMTIGLDVADVDAEFQRLKAMGTTFVTTPVTWPWGARSFHFRDPDGNILCFRTRV